ncbi:MAG: hypothetical protein V1781_05270 [Bacteroidota bacterium]
MKNYLFVLVAVIAAFLFTNVTKSQSKHNDSWPEKTAFHSVMSSTFHPSEEGNLEPIKRRSKEMVQKAKEWMESTPPADFNKPTIKEKLKLLYQESKTLNKLVKSKTSDEEIKTALAKLHDRFHEIVIICGKKCNH